MFRTLIRLRIANTEWTYHADLPFVPMANAPYFLPGVELFRAENVTYHAEQDEFRVDLPEIPKANHEHLAKSSWDAVVHP